MARPKLWQLILQRSVALIVVLVVLGTASTRVGAHNGARLLLAFWGGFPGAAVPCQRMIAEATGACARRVLWLRDRCQRARLVGGTCDEHATRGAVDAARIHALDQIDELCTDEQTRQLIFLGVIEVQADVTNACRRADNAFAPRVYAPTPPVDTLQRRCILATSDATMDVVRYALRTWQGIFDRIAARNLSPQRKLMLVDRASSRIATAVVRARATLQQHCTEADFALTYQQDEMQFFAGITREVECVIGASYVQDRIQCDPLPTPTVPATSTRTVSPTTTPTASPAVTP
jgi:hypothetical protein